MSPKKTKPIVETRSAFAMRLFDTSDPPLSVGECARLAGIRVQTLLVSLQRRERYVTMRCPLCHQLPSRPRDDYGRRMRDQAPPRTQD